MAELRRGLRFANEARAHVGVEREVGRQHLDRDRAVEAQIGGAVDDGHSAAPDLTLDQVLVADRDGDAVAQIVVHASTRGRPTTPGAFRSIAHLVGRRTARCRRCRRDSARPSRAT